MRPETERRDIELEKRRLKKVLQELKKKEGRGTELISLYIPPGRRISDVMSYLREEYGTASNIKSDLTRKHVQDAIVKTMERLKFFDEAPETGLVIFCGAIPQNGIGSEKMEIYTIIPPEPVYVNLYRCDNHFHLEPLEEILKEKEVYGLLTIDVNEASIAILEGSRVKILSSHTSGIPGKHRAGGQSARRFERLREAEINQYFKRVARHVNKAFLDPEYMGRMHGVVVGGPGFTKRSFVDQDLLDYRIKDKILGFVDTSYTGEEGIRELVSKAKKLLEDTRYIKEKGLVDRFLGEISKVDGLATYGLKQVLKALNDGAADVVIVSENLRAKIVKGSCPLCHYYEEEILLGDEVSKMPGEKLCPSCGRTALKREEVDILEYLEEKENTLGTRVEVISPHTEHGRILQQFGGIGALLRYRER